MRPATHLLFTLVLLSAAFQPNVADAAKMYRWTDAEGNTHYTDKIPVEASGQGRTELNKRGLQVDQVAPAKTKEEFERERLLEVLRKEQEALILEQKKKDRALRRTYRTEDDIIMARNGKLAAIDNSKQVIESNIRLTKLRLDELQGRAASLERQGRKIDKELEANIESTWKRLKQEYARIITREQDKDAIRNEFAGYIARFRHLTNTEEARPPASVLDENPTELETVVSCGGAESCYAAWRRAKAYRALHSTTVTQIVSDTIITSMPPSKDKDISITVSRIKLHEGSDEQLFLDLQCKQTPIGKEFCQGEKAAGIRRGFRPFLATQGR